MEIQRIIYYTWKYLKKSPTFIKEFPKKVINWFIDTWEWIADAFSNWDAEIYDMKDELVNMAHKIGYGIRLLMTKLKYFVSEIGEMFNMLMQGFKGWK